MSILNVGSINTTSIIDVPTLEATTINHTNGTNALLIDSGGRVTRPNIPCFSVKQIGEFLPINGNVILRTIILNNGNNYSTTTGNFTAPVAGLYYFSFTGFTENNSSSNNDIQIRRNGTSICRTYTNETVNVYRPFAVCVIIQLSVNDTVRPWTGIDIHGNDNPVFSGFLL
jgi:hypothetical protein